jgi:hypothetical protein
MDFAALFLLKHVPKDVGSSYHRGTVTILDVMGITVRSLGEGGANTEVQCPERPGAPQENAEGAEKKTPSCGGFVLHSLPALRKAMRFRKSSGADSSLRSEWHVASIEKSTGKSACATRVPWIGEE